MSYEKVAQAKQIIVGTKQTVRALKDGKVHELVIAEDADKAIIDKVMEAANDSECACL
ncbi:MAG: hypothetical protein KatS3mg080_0326 [Anoxybacillus sp.]|nr:MAG: hypothetical protein KatS3mg080_0326 [Anoxybacillus sp.]